MEGQNEKIAKFLGVPTILLGAHSNAQNSHEETPTKSSRLGSVRL